MKAPYRLVQNELSHDTLECLEALIRETRAGKIVGVAFVAIKRKAGDGFHHICGAANDRRLLTRGLLRDLDDDLRRVD